MAPKTAKEVQNFLSGKEPTVTKTVQPHPELEDCEAKPYTREMAIRERKQEKSNIIELGAELAELETKEGSERKNKDGQIIMNPDNTPAKYPDKYYATFVFMGGTIQVEVKEVQLPSLIIGETYFCKGRLAMVKNFGKEELAPVFTTFTQLYAG